MLLSRYNLLLLSLLLAEYQLYAQSTPLERSSVGAPTPKADEALDANAAAAVDAMRDPFAEIEADDPMSNGNLFEAERNLESTLTFEASHANGYRAAADEMGQGFDEGALLYQRRSPSVLDTRNLRWDLGASSDYSGSLESSIKEERVLGSHRPSLELAWNGRAFEGDGATLDEIFQGASRLNRDFTAYDAERTTRSSGAIAAGDRVRFGSQSSLTFGGEFRQDHYQIDRAIDEGTIYEAGAINWTLGLGRDSSLQTKFSRAFVRYQDQRSNLKESQDATEAETLYVKGLTSRYQAGLGYRTVDGDRSGPMISMIRKADERGEGFAKLSYLGGGGTHQFLGAMQGIYRFTRLLSMTVNLEQNINLLAAYTNVSDVNRSSIREQNLTKTYNVSWRYDDRRSAATFSVLANSQDYQNSNLYQEEASFAWIQKLNPRDTVTYRAGFRHYVEEGAVARPIDRRGSVGGVEWKHYWGQSSSLLAAKPFYQLGVGFERLWEGRDEMERKTFSLGIGQEWL